jgi:hypothetical protein
MKIETTHVCPPIPTRAWDWSAVDADTYDPDPGSRGDIVGRGPTEREAINNLVEQLIERALETEAA